LMCLKMERMDHTQYMKELVIKERRATTRMGHLPVGGGALNANYTFVDAVANICTTMGNMGLVYGKDFFWAYHGYDDDMDDCITLMVKDEKYSTALHLKLKNNYKIKHTNDGDVKLVKETV
jgi:hypothetical protein